MLKSDGQASMEVIIVVSIVVFLFSMVILQVIAKNRDIDLWSDIYRKEVICNSIADGVSEAFSAGAYAQKNVNLPYRYNVTVYGGEGYIVVGDEPDTVNCNMPAGMMNYSLSFNSLSANFTNSNGLVVVSIG